MKQTIKQKIFKVIILLNLLREETKQDIDNHVNCIWREEKCQSSGKESTHASAEGWEVSAVQNKAPFFNGNLDVHVQKLFSPLSTRFFSGINLNNYSFTLIPPISGEIAQR